MTCLDAVVAGQHISKDIGKRGFPVSTLISMDPNDKRNISPLTAYILFYHCRYNSTEQRNTRCLAQFRVGAVGLCVASERRARHEPNVLAVCGNVGRADLHLVCESL